MKKIKIVYLISTLRRLGPVFVLQNIVNNLDRTKYEIFIITFKDYSKTAIDEELSKIATIISIRGGLFKKMLKVKNILASINPDICHSHGFEADFLNVICASKNTYKVNTLHCCIIDDYKLSFGIIKGYLLGISHLKVIKWLDLPIACSKSVSQYFLEKFSMKIKFAQNGIKELNIVPNKQYKFLNDKITYCYIGNLSKRKKVDILIDSFVRSNINAYLVIVGSGKELEEYKQKYIGCPNIIFTGFLDSPLEILASSDYYVSASSFEGLSISILEAVSLKKPFILSDIPSHREIYEVNSYEISGMIFKDTNELKNLFYQTYQMEKSEYQKLSNASYNTYINHFTDVIMTNQYCQIYDFLLNKGHIL